MPPLAEGGQGGVMHKQATVAKPVKFNKRHYSINRKIGGTGFKPLNNTLVYFYAKGNFL